MIIETNLNSKTINLKNYCKKNNSTEIIVPFENLLRNPIKYLNKVSKSLNVKTDKISLASIKENNLPRKFDYNKERKKTLNYLKKKVAKRYYLKLLNLEKFYLNQIIKKH